MAKLCRLFGYIWEQSFHDIVVILIREIEKPRGVTGDDGGDFYYDTDFKSAQQKHPEYFIELQATINSLG